MSYYLSNLNLNMLVVFDAVCRHLNMTAAAADLGITQPAVSRYIKELKEITGTDLLIRGASGYQLTAEGQIFWQQAVEILNGCEVFTRYAHGQFDPYKDKHQFHVGMGPLNTTYFTEKITVNALLNYPQIHIHLSRHDMKGAFERLYRRELSAYMGYTLDVLPDHISFEPIKKMEYVPVCSVRSPFAKEQRIDAKGFVQTPHIKVYTGQSASVFDRILKKLNLLQDSIIEVPDVASVLVVLKQTDFLFFALRDHAEIFCGKDPELVILEPENFALPPMELNLYWNKSHDQYKPHIWLRQYLQTALNT